MTDQAEHLVANRLSDQLAASHDVLASVRSWMEGQVRFREAHPQWRGLVETMRVQIARCTKVLESNVLKDHPIDPEMKKVQDEFLESMPAADPHAKLAADVVAKATKDDGPPRQQAMAENFAKEMENEPEVGDIVLVELQLPGMRGQQQTVTMPAIVAALNAGDPTKIAINAFPPIGSGLPAMGQLWAAHSEVPTLGCWRWGSAEVRLAALKEIVLDQEYRLKKLESRPAPGPQKPSVGRKVHYGTKPFSAEITAVADGKVTQLCVLGTMPEGPLERTGVFFFDDVPFSDTTKEGHWSWPVFVK